MEKKNQKKLFLLVSHRLKPQSTEEVCWKPRHNFQFFSVCSGLIYNLNLTFEVNWFSKCAGNRLSAGMGVPDFSEEGVITYCNCNVHSLLNLGS